MKKKLLLVIGTLLFILGLTGVNYLIYKGKNDSEISKVQSKGQETKNDMFAIMLQQEDGTYKITDSNSFNQVGYVFNSARSGCIDANGNKIDSNITYNKTTKSVTFRVTSEAYCYVYFDKKSVDIDVAIKTDGVSGKLPTAGGYKNALTCSEGTGTFNNKYQRLEITNVKAKCTLNYERDTGTHTSLVNKITSLARTAQGEGTVVHEKIFENYNLTFTPTGAIEKENYMNLNNDTTYPWTWNDTDKSWASSNKGDSSRGKTSTITFNPNVDGYYQICYIQNIPTPESKYSYGKVYMNDIEILSLYGKTVTNYECKDLGILRTTDTIKVTYQKANYTSAGNDEISFYIQTGTYNESYDKMDDAGYRYEGQDPNNYIWFNNEMWRIIGLIPTKVDASGTTTNLVKIIRKDSMGMMAYDAKASGYTGTWGSNTLYTLLNDYYYGKKKGTNTAYCYGYSTTSKQKCDYSISGISEASTDYYGRMVKNVYWNTGASNHAATASAVYTTEKTKQTVKGRIGLMSSSDFGYAASSANHDSTKLSDYRTKDITLSNWLYRQGIEWTNTQYSDNASAALRVYINLGSATTNNGIAYRPVLYLNENVYVISGSGAEADPYIIGM